MPVAIQGWVHVVARAGAADNLEHALSYCSVCYCSQLQHRWSRLMWMDYDLNGCGPLYSGIRVCSVGRLK